MSGEDIPARTKSRLSPKPQFFPVLGSDSCRRCQRQVINGKGSIQDKNHVAKCPGLVGTHVILACELGGHWRALKMRRPHQCLVLFSLIEVFLDIVTV